MRITDLKVNHLVRPLGYALGCPDFSWKYEGDIEERIESSRIVVWKDGTIVGDTDYTMLDYLGTTLDLALEPRTRYTWQVCARLMDGSVVESDVDWFETGKMDEPWAANWITTEKEMDRHPVFVKKVSISREIDHARLYVIGLGLFETRINGELVSEELLMPYCNAYDQWLQTMTLDVSDFLKEDNEMAITLGNGWYRGRFGFDASNTSPAYGNTQKLLCELHITYKDGSEDVVCSDDTWNVRRSNIIFSNMYDGEIVDDTLLAMDEEKAVYSDEECSEIHDRYSLKVVTHEAFHPTLITTPKNELVLDLGQNIAGIFEMNVLVPFGQKVYLQFGEVLQDGCFYRDNLRTAKAEYTYISNGMPVVIRPHFTFYGYRYVKVEGIQNLNPNDFTGYAIYSDIAMKGILETGNTKVNKLISNALWGMKDNYIDVPTDCPQRDERMGWTGDTQVFSQTAMYFADTYAFFRKYLFDMYQEQKAHDGQVPYTVPSIHIHQAATVWGDACTLIPYYQYMSSGDIRILADQYDSMKAWVDYIRKVDGNDHGWRKQFHFGDWLALDGPKGSEAVQGRTDESFIADVYYYKSCNIVAYAASLLGDHEAERKYTELAERIREDLLRDYYTASGRCAIMTMTGQILSLQEGLGNPKEAMDLLRKLLEFNDGKLETGFVGTPLLCPTLSEYGMSDLAYDLLLNEEYPGWLYEVNLGATTIWERWNSLDENGKITGIGMNSLNHYSYGSIVQWLFAYSAGLRPLKPGYKRVNIEPVIDDRLGYMDCRYASDAGMYRVYWKVLDRYHIEMKWEIPYGCAAEVHLPLYQESDDTIASQFDGDTGIFTQGSYSITYTTSEPTDHVITLNTITKVALQNEKVKNYLEQIPLFAQSEFSFMNLPIRDALSSTRIEPEDYTRIEQEIIALQ